MFTPATHSPRSKLSQPARQTGTDHLLPPLPASFILATTEDDDRVIISNSQQITTYHHNQQYEHANQYCTNNNNYSRSSGCESSPSSYSTAIYLPEQQGTTSGNGSCSLARSNIQTSSSLVIYPLMNDDNHTDTSRDCNYHAAVNVMISNNDVLHRLGDSCSVRRVFSTGDLQYLQMEQQQQQQGSSKESSSSSIIEGMLNKACRYSPEEKRERIERYKTKRSHRNFNKKIKYACRKTLADSRPRIRGRFARNDNSNNNDEDVDKWAAGDHRYYELAADDCENSTEDDNWLDLFNAAWLLK